MDYELPEEEFSTRFERPSIPQICTFVSDDAPATPPTPTARFLDTYRHLFPYDLADDIPLQAALEVFSRFACPFDLFECTLEVYQVLEETTLNTDEIDAALFALYKRPLDEEAQLEGEKGSNYGAFTLIAQDCRKHHRT